MRRGGKAVRYPLVAVALLVLLALSGCDAASNERLPSSGSATASAPAAPAPGGEAAASSSMPKVSQARVNKVVDGDTIWVSLGGRKEKVRFIGVDTPESTTQHEPYGKEASAYAKRAVDGRDVWLQTDVGERDRYGRLLAYVWLERPTSESEAEIRAKMLNARLLADGQAQLMTVPPNVRHVELFTDLQREAREASRGLWALEP